MTHRRAPQASKLLLGPSLSLIGLALFATSSVTSCSDRGAEGDDPVVSPVSATRCKLDAPYARYRFDAQASAAADAPSVSDREVLSSGPRRGSAVDYRTVEQALLARDETPIALECLQWNHGGGKAMFSFRNFAGPCSVVWDGEATLKAPGEVVIGLHNSSCEIARCGSCIYDVNAELAGPLEALVAPGSSVTRVTLELHDCKGESTQSYDWEIFLKESGASCRPVDGWSWFYEQASQSEAFTETQLNLYAPCGDSEGAVECTEDRSCSGGYCVPGCGADVDCPLGGALTCREGACLVKP
jgi:hypothetical protein